MKNADMPAMPISRDLILPAQGETLPGGLPYGLTKREYAAIELMQGILAADTRTSLAMDRAIPMAVRIADELFKELEKEV